jgi:FkbM family methyltransferase
MKPPEGYRFERGLLWPAYDVKCAAVVFKMSRDLDAILKFVPGRDTVIQAGGNCGVWPRTLAPLFSRVLTFEPDSRNYKCLEHNTRGLRGVVAFNYALGDVAGYGTMDTPSHETDNCGALQFVPAVTDSGASDVPMMRIDSLGLTKCDLIYLDIEGFEIPALRGALETILRCKPVIVIEDKGLSERYGYKQGEAFEVLRPFGYKIVQKIHRDVVFAPNRHP